MIRLVLFSFLFLSDCKNPKLGGNLIYVPEPNLTDEVAILKVSKQVFGDLLRETKLEKEQKGYKLFIEFGGSTALTFYGKQAYVKDIKLMICRKANQMFYNLKDRNLETLTISFVKPYYVKDNELNKEIIQEFEVFRVRFEKTDLEKISNWKEKAEKLLKNEARPKETVEFLDSIRKNWNVELDEFYRVEIK
ncbi:MAG: hypothetical protein SFU98_15270 [Leptospiraceae bacterium]|nr:hypothetical protein [Leptospiraceae bacterium]